MQFDTFLYLLIKNIFQGFTKLNSIKESLIQKKNKINKQT